MMAEAKTAKAAADAARAGAISGAAELRESAASDAENTRAEAHRQVETILERARAQSADLLAQAVGEATITREEGTQEAERLVHDARREALAIIDEIRAETEALLIHATALGDAAPAPAPELPEPPEVSTEPINQKEAPAAAAPTDDKSAEPAPTDLDEDALADSDYVSRESIYARRSANLPAIGERGVSEALAAVSAMRISLGNSLGSHRSNGKAKSKADGEAEVAVKSA